MTGSDFDSVYLLHCKYHKINIKRGGSNIDFPDWIKSKKITENPIIKDDNISFQYAATVALKYGKIVKNF